MAEFCLDCYNKLNGTHYGEGAVKLDYDLCEGCGEWKLTIAYFHPWAGSLGRCRGGRKETALFQDLKASIKRRKGQRMGTEG